MPAPATIDVFLEVLGKSGLVEAERLRQFVQQHAGLSATPRKLAARLVAAGLLTQFQAEQVLLGKHRGFTLGKYRILERLGVGGHSTVYLGEHVVVKRRVAIKVLPTARAENPAALARFYREARAAGALDHPNLVKAHDVDCDNGLHFLVMDYVDGSSLQQIVSRFGPLAIERSAHYICQAAQGLQAAHAAGLVHRDVKPANILLDRYGSVRVLDLGLARFFCDEADPLTLKFDNNSVLGTADYVAPEQALNSHEVDGRADIYSLGATFYFLLTGRPLFPEGHVTHKLIWHQTRQPLPLRELRPEVPPGLAAIIERMIEKVPERRFAAAGEVMEALEPWTAIPIPPPSEEEMPRRSPAVRAAVIAEADSESDLAPGPRSPGLPRRSLSSLVLPAVPAPASQVRPRSASEMTTPSLLSGQVETHRASLVAPSALLAATSLPATPAAKPRSRRRLLRFVDQRVLSSLLLLLLGVFTGAGIRLATQRDAPGSPSMQPQRPQGYAVRRVSHAPEDYPSVAEALRDAPDHTEIVICEPVWREALRYSGEDSPPRVLRITGRSPDGTAVRWQPPAEHPTDQPLLRICEGARLTLSGFTLNGEGRIQELVAVAGLSAGLTLEDLELCGFRQNGVVLHHCTGSAEHPILLRRLRIASGGPASSAIVLAARDGESNRHVRILDCSLEGPYQVPIRLQGPARDLELHRNRP